MTREVIDNFEDHINSLKTEWHVMKEKWFHGEMMDPVFEGVVRDFCNFDQTMHNVYENVQVFMKGVEQLAVGMTVLSEGVSGGLSHTNDSLIASDSCKLKEATNQIARSDAPHSSIAKLRRDMHFNILNPVQNHIANNKNLKVSLDIRRRRLIELNSAKKHFDEVEKKNISHTDRRYLQAQSTFESAKMTFNDVDRHVFEWLYILEEYRGDILDSTLQTLKYLEYEFFASSAHAISTSLPTRMEFRPMVEMTPEHLEAQVEMELQKNEDNEAEVAGAPNTGIIDFSARLIDKKVKEEPADGDSGVSLPVDPLSLSSLLSQGFEEGPARKALRKHQNNTQAAMDWLINGQCEEEEKKKSVADGVRMPTTVKRVQKLKAMRRAQAEKIKEKRDAEGGGGGEADSGSEHAGGGASNGHGASKDERPNPFKGSPPPPPKDMPARPPPDLMDGLMDEPSGQAAKSSGSGVSDLLGFDDARPAVPTDFSKPIDVTSLPAQFSFDTSKCEKQPLSAAVAAGLAQNRTVDASSSGSGLPHGLDFGLQAAPTAGPGALLAAAAGGEIPADLLAAVQALAAQSQVSPEALLAAARQLQAAGGLPGAAPAPTPVVAPALAPAVASSGWDRLTGPTPAVGGAFEGLDALAGLPASPSTAPASGVAKAAGTGDAFGDLMSFGSPPRPGGGGYPGTG